MLGPGTIGLMVLLSLKAAGATNVLMAGTGTDGTRLDLALTLGAKHVINAEKESVFEKAMDLTNGEGFDFVFEASGSTAAFSQALNLAKPWGKVVSTGTYKDNAAFNPSSLVSYNKTIIGSGGYSSTTWRRAVALVAERIISLEALVSKTFPLDEASAAFELAAQRDVAKIVLAP